MDDACQGKNGTLKETWSNCQCNFIYKTTKFNECNKNRQMNILRMYNKTRRNV